MVTIPARVKEKLVLGVKRFQPIVSKANSMDINESDTVTIISDILSDVFGYDKYTEITSEYAIKKTFCDLAIKIDGVPKLLIECKAAGLNLKEQHIRQAVDYSSNSGIEWVILTNGVFWKVYTITFGKPVSFDLVYEFEFTALNAKKETDLEMLYHLTRHAMTKGSKTSLEEFHAQQLIVNKYTIGQILLSDSTLDAVRRAVKKIAPETKISNEEIKRIIEEEIIKREVLDNEKTVDAKKKVTKALKTEPKATRASKTETPETEPGNDTPAE